MLYLPPVPLKNHFEFRGRQCRQASWRSVARLTCLLCLASDASASGSKPDDSLPPATRELVSWEQAETLLKAAPAQQVLQAKGAEKLGRLSGVTAALLPKLEARGGFLQAYSTTDFPTATASAGNAALKLSIPILVLRSWRQRSAARKDWLAAQLDQADAFRRQVGNLLELILTVQATEKLYRVAEENTATAEAALAHIQGAAKFGASSRLDVERAEEQLLEARDEQLTALSAALEMRFSLGSLLGSSESWSVDPGKSINEFWPTRCVPIERLAERTDVRAVRARREASQHRVSAGAYGLLPEVSLVAEESYSTNPFAHFNGERLQLSGGVVATWSLFDGGRAIAETNEARAEVAQFQATTRQSLIAAQTRVRLLETGLHTAEQRMKIAISQRERARSVLKMTSAGKTHGKMTSLELSTAQRNARASELKVVVAELDVLRLVQQLRIARSSC